MVDPNILCQSPQPLIATQKAVQGLVILSSLTAWPVAGHTKPLQLLSSMCAEPEGWEQGEWTQGREGERVNMLAGLLKYHWFPMNAPLIAKGSNTAPTNSCTSGSHFSVHTSLQWQIHKSLAKEAAVPLPASDVIFLRWITPPSADSWRSNDQARHRDTAMMRMVKEAINFLRTAWPYLPKAN